MPPATSMKDFIRAVKTRKSEIAKKLDDASERCNPGSPNWQQNRQDLRDLIDSWDPGNPPAAHDLYGWLGLSQEEVGHIIQWGQAVGNGNALAELKVAALDATLPPPNGKPMEFFWELVWNGPNESNQNIHPKPDITEVTFYTPSQKVTRNGNQIELDEVNVDI
jgi:hypothetical protein